MTGVDVGLLRKVLEWAELEDARGADCAWDQGSWFAMSKGVLSAEKRAKNLRHISFDELIEMNAFSELWQDCLYDTTSRLDYLRYFFGHGVYVLNAWRIDSCGSTGCIAGYACMTAGDCPVLVAGRELGERGGLNRAVFTGTYVLTPGMKIMEAPVRAADVLGIDRTTELFADTNDIQEVRRIAEAQVGEKL